MHKITATQQPCMGAAQFLLCRNPTSHFSTFRIIVYPTNLNNPYSYLGKSFLRKIASLFAYLRFAMG